METRTDAGSLLADLNPQQREAATHGAGPLLIVAGAGTGKTKTLVHRVAHAIRQGCEPRRILLLTFTRRAAAEMLRRVEALARRERGGRARGAGDPRQIWGGTFHAVATRLLRIEGKRIGLDPGFTIQDRSDSEDLLDVARTDLGLARTDKRFPKKGTCLDIYSHLVNSRRPLAEVLGESFPWCEEYAGPLKKLFAAYTDRKERASVLDYDDLLLFWHGMLADGAAGDRVRERFDMVLVDEYQDTNLLQAEILRLLRPDGTGLTAVGDDAQSIYSFRAATVRNILDFPRQFAGTTVVVLEQNYRSVQPILAATNSVISQARERFTKDLWSQRKGGERPILVTCQDEDEQAEFVARSILERREAGADLKRQAVLFRASHHSMVLEAELSRRKVPFVKYGGLKFVETAHVKDLLSFLRLAENPRDLVAGTRILTLLPGIGPKIARRLMDLLLDENGNFEAWQVAAVPAASASAWQDLMRLLRRLAAVPAPKLAAQVHLVRTYYGPLLEDKYDRAEPRLRDLEQLEHVAGRFPDRRTMLAEMTLDPPVTTQDLAADPLLDEDYLILSTIHSAKGLEWDDVYVIHAADGNIPSDMATRSPEQIEEERRLFYVALTRARDRLCVCFPQRYYHAYRGPRMDQYGFAQLTRFLPRGVRKHFDERLAVTPPAADEDGEQGPPASRRIRGSVRAMFG
jgi:DNA helicase-2/ATP-dependent DNA helicase PcrA